MPAESKQKTIEDISQVEKEVELISWKARSRPFKKRSREFYINVIAVSSLLGLILFLIEGIVPVLLIVALIFLFYVFSTVEPDEINYSLTSYGIRIGDELIRTWPEMGRYWIKHKMDHDVLIMETNTPPWKVEMVLKSDNKKEVEDIVSKILYENEDPDTSLDKVASWVGDKILK